MLYFFLVLLHHGNAKTCYFYKLLWTFLVFRVQVIAFVALHCLSVIKSLAASECALLIQKRCDLGLLVYIHYGENSTDDEITAHCVVGFTTMSLFKLQTRVNHLAILHTERL